MKLLLLLSDEAQIAHRRDAELKSVQEEKDDAKQKVAALLDDLLKQPGDHREAGDQCQA
jgi:mediator of RNA polymerase II transcription subunit 22